MRYPVMIEIGDDRTAWGVVADEQGVGQAFMAGHAVGQRGVAGVGDDEVALGQGLDVPVAGIARRGMPEAERQRRALELAESLQGNAESRRHRLPGSGPRIVAATGAARDAGLSRESC